MIRIGILGGAEIAYRRFLPAIQETQNVSCVGVASSSDERRKKFQAAYNIAVYPDYDTLLKVDDIDAVYLPLPPALHYDWAFKALERKKHVFLEKPSTDSLNKTLQLVEMAKDYNLVLHENYMFQYHSQLSHIMRIVQRGDIGDIKVARAAFTFPMRKSEDFRYKKKLGGGALLDAGGYIAKLGQIILGSSLYIRNATSGSAPGYEVDTMGSMEMSNKAGIIFQGVYGFGIQYQCSLELLGSKGRLYTDRIFTAPPDFCPHIEIETTAEKHIAHLASDNHFSRSIECFCKAVEVGDVRCQLYKDVVRQAELVEQLKYCGGLSF